MIYSYKFIKTAESINPLILSGYLESTGWQQYQNNMKNIRVYPLRQGDKLFMINLPLDNDLCDYTLEMCDAVETLAAAENKTIAQIMLHLLNPYTDILMVQFACEADDIFRFSLDDTIQLYTNLKALLNSAAMEVVKIEQLSNIHASRFLSECKLSQREDNAHYLVSMICPFTESGKTESHDQAQKGNANSDNAMCFSRKVIRRVMENVSQIHSRLENRESVRSDNQEQDYNISTDFVHALYNLNVDPKHLDVEFSVEWSPEETGNMNDFTKMQLSHDEFQRLV